MPMRMLVALRIQRGGCQRAEVCAWHCKIRYLKARIMRRYSGRNEWGEGLANCQSQCYSHGISHTYRVVLAHVISLLEEGLLGVHLLHVPVRIAMHFDAIRCWRNTLVGAEHVVLRLGEDWRASLAELAHGIVKCSHVVLRLLPAIMLVLGNLRGEIVERGRNIGGSGLVVVAVVFALIVEQVEVEGVEVD
jgi:hypothetical protein